MASAHADVISAVPRLITAFTTEGS
jgi:hypothetical protein